MADAYYREGEDEDTPQEVVDDFIRLLFDHITAGNIDGCFLKTGDTYAGFALWALDTEDFAFSELPGYGVILEIGLSSAFRKGGHGTKLVSFIENRLKAKHMTQCYVSAYGPAQAFWSRCGYTANGTTASNGLPIMIKTIG